jgi:hypothetical protein
MIDIPERVEQLSKKGLCCAQMVMAIGLEMRDESNDRLVRAMAGACNGLCSESACGAFIAGACLLALFTDADVSPLVRRLRQVFESEFSSINCPDLVDFRQRDYRKCREITVRTCEICFEILEDNGLLE